METVLRARGLGISTTATADQDQPERSRKRRWVLLGAGGGGVILLLVQWAWVPVLIQPTGSATRGVWLRTGGQIEVGSMVLFDAPAEVKPLLVEHGYPADAALLKHVAATPPFRVDTMGEVVLLDGEPGGRLVRTSRQGRPFPVWRAEQQRVDDAIWVESTSLTSVDSRSFGPLRRDAVVGVYRLWWAWE